MKTNPTIADIERAMRNACTPAATLANWQRMSSPNRLAQFKARASYYQSETLADWRKRNVQSAKPFELSSPEAVKPLLWINGDSREVEDFLKHEDTGRDGHGWYCCDYCDDTIQAASIRLRRFPRLVFAGTYQSNGDAAKIELRSMEAIDFSECESERDAEESRSEALREACESYDSTAEREAEEEKEYQAKDRAEQDLEEKREELKTLRGKISGLIGELRQLCGTTLPQSYPVAAHAIQSTLKGFMEHRNKLIGEIAELRESIS